MKIQIKELERRVNEEAVNTFGINFGWAKAMNVQEIGGARIVPIAIYRNRDAGVDPAVEKIEFYEIRETPNLLKSLDLDYTRPVGDFYHVFPIVRLAEKERKLVAEIEIVNSRYVGYTPHIGNEYTHKTLDKKTIELYKPVKADANHN